MRGNHPGFPLIPTGVARVAGLGPATTLGPGCHPAQPGATSQISPSAYRKESRHCRSAALSMRGDHPGFPLIPPCVARVAGLGPATALGPGCHPAQPGATSQISPSAYRKESSPGGGAARAMRGNHPGFPLIPTGVARVAGLGPATALGPGCHPAQPGATSQISHRIPEGEQPRRRSRPGDEREPSRVPSHTNWRRQGGWASPSHESGSRLSPSTAWSYFSDKPIRIPEGEQTLPQRGTVDERGPSRVPSHTPLRRQGGWAWPSHCSGSRLSPTTAWSYFSDKPIRIPEREQPRRRTRLGDEREPSRVPSHTNLRRQGGWAWPSHCSGSRLSPSTAWSYFSDKPPHTGRRAAPAAEPPGR